ncbi:hypothetical protein B0J17DRAFT_447930 [Rhizoctonia solani]|nr:hypothetical protein B0J17DRAFT_447930 [Rhizoctonia solani]
MSNHSIVGYALRPFVQHLALASRFITPSTNKLITSMNASHCSQSRFLLDFRTDEGKANAQNWYKRQGRNTRFTLLEYRKDKRGQVKHEFIVVWLNSTTLCRFDRRARDDKRGHVLKEGGAPADDSAHVLSSFETEYRELLEKTEVLLTIKLPHGEDLGVILSICAGIQIHAKASAYSLLQYNCYFFAWMITAAVARRTYNWETDAISKEGWDDILRTSLTKVFEPEIPRRPGLKSKLSRVFIKSRTKSSTGTNSSGNPANVERFRYELLSQYSDSYRAIEKILPKLLLRSQLGSVLKKELSHIESDGISSVKRVIAKDRAIDRALEYASRKLPPQEKATDGLQRGEVDSYLR